MLCFIMSTVFLFFLNVIGRKKEKGKKKKKVAPLKIKLGKKRKNSSVSKNEIVIDLSLIFFK